MKIHPLLSKPNAVFVMVAPLEGEAEWDDFRQAAHQAMEQMQVRLENETAVLKPNVTSGEHFGPDSGVITHPGFIEGLTGYLRGNGAKRTIVVEDPRDTDDNNPRDWTFSGYGAMAERIGLPLFTPTTWSVVKRKVPKPVHFPTLKVSRQAIAPGNVLINVPKLKCHNLAITTLGMKNLMGLVNVFDRHYCFQAYAQMPEAVRKETRPRPEWMTRELHELWQTGLAKRLADTAQVLQPALTIVEGVVGREGTGFNRGRNRTLGLVAAGINVVAVDAAVSWLVGFDPLRLVYLRLAAGMGLGENDPAKLDFIVPGAKGLERAADPASLRTATPFQVISGIVDENIDLFNPRRPVSADDPAPLKDGVTHDPILSIIRTWKETLEWPSTSVKEAS